MDLFPTAVGTRPRLACEIRPEGVVVARGESPSGTLTAVARVDLRPGLVAPGLKAGNLQERPPVVAALRRAFDAIAARGADRSKYVTVIVPDAAVRVLLLDFDALPSKPAEALQVVRFRLKKLLPFDVDHALVSFQIMSTERSILRVLAVAIPQEVLAEYEAVIAEAGMQPGVVLPSTLAALAGLDPALANALVLNVSPVAVTTAIVRAGILLLHRTIEVYPAEAGDTAGAVSSAPPSAVISTSSPRFADETLSSASRLPAEAQRSPAVIPTEAQRPPAVISTEAQRPPAVISTEAQRSPAVISTEAQSAQRRDPFRQEVTISPLAARSPSSAPEPYLDLGTSASDSSSSNLAIVDPSDTVEEWSRPESFLASFDAEPVHPDPEFTVTLLNTAPDVRNRHRDLAESVSVAAAYFEDTLGTVPDLVLSAGSITAADLDRTLAESGLEGLRVRDLLESEALGAGASTTTVPSGWLAGVRGALRS